MLHLPCGVYSPLGLMLTGSSFSMGIILWSPTSEVFCQVVLNGAELTHILFFLFNVPRCYCFLTIHSDPLLGTPSALRTVNSSWHRINKLLQTFLRGFGSYWHHSITQVLQIYQFFIQNVDLLFHQIPKVLSWTVEGYSDLTVTSKKPVWDHEICDMVG